MRKRDYFEMILIFLLSIFFLTIFIDSEAKNSTLCVNVVKFTRHSFETQYLNIKNWGLGSFMQYS